MDFPATILIALEASVLFKQPRIQKRALGIIGKRQPPALIIQRDNALIPIRQDICPREFSKLTLITRCFLAI